MTVSMTRIALSSALALVLGACASTPQKLQPGASIEEPKAIAVTLVKLNHDIRFKDGVVGVDDRQEADLSAFLASSDRRGADHVFVVAGSTSLDGDRASGLVTRLAARGVGAAVIRDSGQAAGVLRVIIEHYVASAPDCPDWSRTGWVNFNNLTSSNLGCATSADLAAMVADPHDLINGRTPGPVVGDPAIAAVERYHAGPILLPGGAGGSATGGAGGGGAGVGGGGAAASGP